MIYLVYYDYEDGNDRESWSVFYTPVEAFTDKDLRDKRTEFIKNTYPGIGTHCKDLEISNTADTIIDDSYIEGN